MPEFLGGSERRHKVAMVGSGNWGSTVGKIVAENTKAHPELFEEEVQMWVFEEEVTVDGKPQKLSEVINTRHENVKYLPNAKLPSNLIANPDLTAVVEDASILVFNLPHQFLDRVCSQIKGHILPFARAISCIKGVHISDDGVSLFSEWIGDSLGIYCGALSGANIASDIAREKWCETTIAYDPPLIDPSRNVTPRSTTPLQNGDSPKGSQTNLSITPLTDLRPKDARGRTRKTKLVPVPPEYAPLDHDTFETLFARDYFSPSLVTDVAGVSLGGALKNITALAAGMVDGLGETENAKVGIARIGHKEATRFGKSFFGETFQESTMNESCGWPDLMVSCTKGRNFTCAKKAVEEGVSVQEIEARDLNGQKLQGTTTAQEVYSFLKARGLEKEYPLFSTVCAIVEKRSKPADLLKLETHGKRRRNGAN